MSFRDYSIAPASNTALGDGTYIGPNMLRNKVRPALQQIAADGKELADDFATLAAGSSDATFTQNGAGAVERTVLSKLRDVVSIVDFGAVDGAADVTANIAAARAASPEIFIPAGTWNVSSLPVPEGTTIHTAGHATIIQQKSNPVTDTSIVSVNGSNVTIGSLTVKGQLGLAESVIGTATVSIASPGVVARNAHGLIENKAVMLRTTGALPTGLTPEIAYYVRNPAANTFELATLPNGASINTSGVQSGVHTLYHANEQSSAIRIEANDTVGDLANITIGDVIGENIRGDVLTTYSRDSHTMNQVRVGHLYGTNIYRCVAAPCTGSGVEIASIGGTQIGFKALLVEPDGTCAPIIGCEVGHVEGRYASVAGTDATRYVDGVEIGTLDLDPAHGGGSTPAYPFSVTDALQVRNCKSLKIGKYKVNGFTGNALKCVWNGGELATQNINIGRLEVPSGTPADGFLLLGNADNFRLEVGHVLATVPAAGSLFRSFGGLRVHSADVTLGAGANFMSSCDYGSGDYVKASGAGNLLSGGTNMTVNGGAVDGLAGIFSFTSLGMIRNLTATALTAIVNGGMNDHSYENCTINGTYHRHTSNSGAITGAGAITSSGATSGIGYATGAGGTVTQITSKATGVTLNKVSGQVTMHNAALAAGAKASFVVTNSTVAATDAIIPSVASGGTANAYRSAVTAVAAGSFTITVENITAGSLSEAPVIGFAVVKGAAA